MSNGEPTKKNGFVIDQQATVTIGACVGICVALIGGFIGVDHWLDNRFNAQDEKIAQQEKSMNEKLAKQAETAALQNEKVLLKLESLDAQFKSFEQRTSYRWSALQMKEWAIEFRKQNPDLIVPPVEAHP